MNAISCDWSEDYEKYDLQCPNIDNHKETDEYDSESCECCQNGYVEPMMNFLYPLDYTYSDIQDRALEVAKETNCVLVQNTETEEWFLTLTGGGMDLSPSIGLAYVIAQTWLPRDLLHELKAGWCKDSLSLKNFKRLRKTIREQLKNEKTSTAEALRNWSKPVKDITQ